MNSYNFSKAFDFVWQKVQELNRRIDEEKPWSLAKEGKTSELEKCLTSLAHGLILISDELSPFLPETAAKIRQIFQVEKITAPKTPLFPKN